VPSLVNSSPPLTSRVTVRASSHVLYLLSVVEITEPKQVYSCKLWFASKRTIKDIIIIIDDTKKTSWMALHEHERDLLEDTMYQHLAALWSEFSNTITVFDAHTATQQLCA
jgi:hypothetical protein